LLLSHPQVYLVSSAVTTTTAHFYGSGAFHPAVYYLPQPSAYSPFFRSPVYNPYVPTPSYYAPFPNYAGGTTTRRVVTPGSDVVVSKPASRSSDDSTVVEASYAAPAPTAPNSIPNAKLIAAELISPGLVYVSPGKARPDVITHGMHLGNVASSADGYAQDGYAEDAPSSIITQGPDPGSYTAVSSDEESEGTLFQSQDGNGNILFGHSSPQQARLESRSLDGSVRGSYSYVDPDGKTVKVRYAAGRSGFQVFDEEGAPSVLPQQVRDTPEVEAAKALHARLYQQAKLLAERSDDVPLQDDDKVITEGDLYDVDDKFHPPDSLYAVGEGIKGVEEDLEYYGAAKGQHMVYASRFNAYGGAHPNEQQHLRRAAPSPFAAAFARLSPFSAPSFREQQHLHRSAKSLKQQQQPSSPDGYTVPVFVGVAPQQQQQQQSDDIASLRTAASPLPLETRSQNNQPREQVRHQQQAIPPASISQKANFFGAVPVAAVHDAQVSPGQRVQDHQTKPVYVEAN
jgi:Insect cuticle protein